MRTQNKKKARKPGVSHRETVYVTVCYPEADAEKLKEIAKLTGRSLSGLIRHFSMNYVEELKKNSSGVSHRGVATF